MELESTNGTDLTGANATNIYSIGVDFITRCRKSSAHFVTLILKHLNRIRLDGGSSSWQNWPEESRWAIDPAPIVSFGELMDSNEAIADLSTAPSFVAARSPRLCARDMRRACSLLLLLPPLRLGGFPAAAPTVPSRADGLVQPIKIVAAGDGRRKKDKNRDKWMNQSAQSLKAGAYGAVGEDMGPQVYQKGRNRAFEAEGVDIDWKSLAKKIGLRRQPPISYHPPSSINASMPPIGWPIDFDLFSADENGTFELEYRHRGIKN
ncbi:hypothetical protein DAPPUDRAFT_239913 [Daphnia pulex]|uniref:Uncharacterized protein n=1 Tax=Daphnia pulex TaxID=6669 RepID=E9GAE7_DAPPU|nr:hypothetical protein DAPPUDRAFT_239913 [Daphnia pulex]|eukprot:EFX83226.1 hypothetical protein DAPPUDRAFT_239913 [Daphnia pulex]